MSWIRCAIIHVVAALVVALVVVTVAQHVICGKVGFFLFLWACCDLFCFVGHYILG